MKSNIPNRRIRGRSRNKSGAHPNKNRVYDSNGPDVRIRGTAHQIVDKYMGLAKDAQSASDSVLAQSYLQHAEHYQRIINDWDENLSHYKKTGHFREQLIEEENSETSSQPENSLNQSNQKVMEEA